MKKYYALLLILMLTLLGYAGNYAELFESETAWSVKDTVGVDLRIEDEHLLFNFDLPNTFFWTALGRRGCL